VGIGGSATNDGGIGMAQALGVKFFNKAGKPIKAPASGKELAQIGRIDLNGLNKRLKGVSVVVACDVNNPMTGKNGASAVYGPQKGATPAMVKKLDANLKHFGKLIKSDLEKNVLNIAGAGAAGGLGAGLVAFTGARIRSGIDIVVEATGLKKAIKGADLVITGEGRVDFQTAFGSFATTLSRTKAGPCGVRSPRSQCLSVLTLIPNADANSF